MTSPPETFDRFVRAAEQYCQLVEESPQARGREDFVWALRVALAEALACGYALPEVDPSTEEPPGSRDLEDWKAVFRKVQVQMEELPGGAETTLVVADDLADVWRDLRRGLDGLASGARWEDVSWEWKFGLQTHWGKHAEDALVALHDA